jgi:lipopolysaccharide/colanic/teichoic acid biosynthesis glycosyltransferase
LVQSHAVPIMNRRFASGHFGAVTFFDTNAAVLSPSQAIAKRLMDVAVAIILLTSLGWLLLVFALVSGIVHGGSGFFVQDRIGRYGRVFPLVKLKTMRTIDGVATTVTTAGDERITPFGRFLRRTKLDELPQLVNVLVGHMSLVGPRPDVPGFADRLEGDDRIILSVAPGITGPATLAYRDEEVLLAGQEDPERFNIGVIFPRKVALNRRYVEEYALWRDLVYLWRTAVGS